MLCRPRSLAPLSCLFVLALAAPAYAGDVEVQLGASDGFVVKGNGASLRLDVDGDTGNISRNGALFVHTTGNDSTFVGRGAGNTSMSGFGGNSGFGDLALSSGTTGGRNSAFGDEALANNTTGDDNSAFGWRALYQNFTSYKNSAFGSHALMNSVGFSGAFGYYEGNNSAFGANALRSNVFGTRHSAFGADALRSQVGDNLFSAPFANSAFGESALYSNTDGFGNSAFGSQSLFNNTTGSDNVAVGKNAGRNQTTGSDNVYIANSGSAAENGQIKIGTVGTHTQAHMAGIFGNNSPFAADVKVNSDGLLGTTTSSARFKQDVRDMGAASELLTELRPVVFRYREEVVGKEYGRVPQYGLIAEEVAEVAPELVVPDADGSPYTIRYDQLGPLLLNEVQKQHTQIEALLARVEQLESELGSARASTSQ